MALNTELAWAAGFFDGEGCTSVMTVKAKSGQVFKYVQIGINQVDIRNLERFQRAVGYGTIYGPDKPKKPTHQPRYSYRTGSRYSFRVLKVLWPYLNEGKKEQARRVYRAIAS